mgnify:CR=1 FL=1
MFVSPVIDMVQLIQKMMGWANVTEEQLNFPLFCPKCKHENLIKVERMKIVVIQEPDAQTQSR